MPNRVRWVHLTTAPDQLSAEMWQGLLRNEEIPAMIRAGDAVSFLGVSSAPCRLMVPEDRLEEARTLLEERFRPEAPA